MDRDHQNEEKESGPRTAAVNFTIVSQMDPQMRSFWGKTRRRFGHNGCERRETAARRQNISYDSKDCPLALLLPPLRYNSVNSSHLSLFFCPDRGSERRPKSVLKLPPAPINHCTAAPAVFWEVPDMTFAKLCAFLTPSPHVRIWI